MTKTGLPAAGQFYDVEAAAAVDTSLPGPRAARMKCMNASTRARPKGYKPPEGDSRRLAELMQGLGRAAKSAAKALAQASTETKNAALTSGRRGTSRTQRPSCWRPIAPMLSRPRSGAFRRRC